MRHRVFVSAALFALFALSREGVARADAATGTTREPGAEDPTMRPVVPERRAGLVVGAAVGVGFSGASGYPNEARLIGDPAYYSQSPLLVGYSTTYFLMGALTDWVSFGPAVTIAGAETSEWKSTAFGIGFRAEIFPLYRLVPRLADTAIYLQGGVGTSDLEAKGPYPTADGTQAFVSAGLHHEFRLAKLLGGHASAGPYVEYDAVYASAAERHWAAVGLRLAFYGGSVVADGR